MTHNTIVCEVQVCQARNTQLGSVAFPKTSIHLSSLKEAFSIVGDLPYCSGRVYRKLLRDHPSFSKLFYQVGDHQAAFIDFSTCPTSEHLQRLADACTPATFGVNDEDVLDESYRRAGKMDATAFSTALNLNDLGILDDIAGNLLQGRRAASGITAELYKLNVYGPGHFFKPHVDTPRADNMFGTLVLVLPTDHEGGALLLRYSDSEWDHEWTFDSAAQLKTIEDGQTDTPALVYTAFYSNIQHEVQLVSSGYRVTLTYNLYYRDTPFIPAQPDVLRDDPGISDMRESLTALLEDPAFLPGGGLLGFGLSHRYPVNSNTKLGDLRNRLRGPDAVIRDLCKELEIKVALKALYRDEDEPGFCLSNRIIGNIHDAVDSDNGLMTYLVDEWNAQYCRDFDSLDDDHDSMYPDSDFTTVVWIKSPDQGNLVESHFPAYGNEPSIGYLYGEVCLVATVARAADRCAT